MKTSSCAAFVLSLIAGVSLAAATGEPSPEMAVVNASDRAYEAAFAKGDVMAMVELFAEDVIYTSDAGETYEGRAALREVLKAAQAANKGARIVIKTDTVRLLTPDVIVEKGSSSIQPKTGESAGALFTAIHVRKDGKWTMSQLVESPLPDDTPADHLAELAWYLGDWEEADEIAGVTIKSHCQWGLGGAFITRNVTVKKGGEVALEGTQVIGWDPAAGTIRSWTFDGNGGYSEGLWTQEGQRWLVREKGYSGDGSRTTSEQTITKAGEDKYFWESGNRTLDGDPLPGIGRIQILRVKKGE